MNSATKPWIKSEQKLGFRAANLSFLFGGLGVVCGIIQAGAAARLLASLLHVQRGGISASIAGLVFALAVLARAGLQLRNERGNFELGAAARRRLRGQVLSALLALGPAGLRGRHSAELAASAVDRVEAMDGFHARWVPATGMAIIGPGLIGLVALLLDWRSGLILILAGLFVPFAMAVAGIGAGIAAKKQFLAMTRLQVRFMDRIRGISTIVLAGRSEDEARALAGAARELRERTMRVLRVAFLSSTALDLAAAAALILIVVRFAPALHGAHELAPTALFLVLLVPEFFAPLRAFSAVYGDRMAVEAVAEELSTLPDAPAPVPPVDIRSVAAQGVTLAFEHVTYGWHPARPVVEDLSFKVGRGEMLLLTGASGTGKSTIIDLILGFLAPQGGRITINGAVLEDLVPAARTRMLGWIGQKPVIFAGTIEENIRFANPAASEDELKDAIRNAHLEELVAALPQGVRTPLGEGGFGVSGGQAQRIAIARAFLKDAPLLLLDEPTSHLDPAVERDILESLKHLAAGRTVVLATHSTQALDLAKTIGAKRVDLDALRYASWRGAQA
ncbi:thiol reductant ABC exporter subunit CydD [Acidocella facilis]|uniref:thiol reductant ABC exporter subunit CydD n=1 Tax=Acidocella facilis TaxID=525 RepID=UPI00047E0AD3|nr:thiol reductant ABC exporter subunit CydD [Acidocella facilis]